MQRESGVRLLTSAATTCRQFVISVKYPGWVFVDGIAST